MNFYIMFMARNKTELEPKFIYMFHDYIIIYSYYIYIELMRKNRLLNNSEIVLVCPEGKKTILTEPVESILPCKVGDILFCLSNVCADCYKT